MPDLAEDLRLYFDELTRRVEHSDDQLSRTGPSPVPAHRREGRRRPALVPMVVGLIVLMAITGVVLASRRSTNAPLDVGGPTTDDPAPTVTSATSPGIDVLVDPSGGLLDGQTVTVHATGLAAGQMVAVVICDGVSTDAGDGAAHCDLETLLQVAAGPDGVVDTPYRVRRLIRVDGAYDCGTQPDGCKIAVGPIQPVGAPGGASAAITFADGPAAPLPSISMTPSTGLRDGQTVTITGAGFAPDIDVVVTECPPDTDCGYEPFGVTAHTNSTGGFRQPLTLHRTFVVPANRPNGVTEEQLDCTTGCTINAVESGPASNLSADPLPFTIVG